METQAAQAVKEHEQAGKDSLDLSFHRNPREKFAVFRELLQHEGLPPHEKAYNRISHEAVTLMAAGGETTASTLMVAVYFILIDKHNILSRLREEVESLMSTGISRPSIADLETLPWLVRASWNIYLGGRICSSRLLTHARNRPPLSRKH